jgi:zinc/manganese transport system substrate-binding protein
MKLFLSFLMLFFSLNVHAELKIFACEPEWGALVKELVGEKADIYIATTAQQDPHHIEARPSLLAKARQANLLICTGAELEIGWLPILLQKTGNKAIQKGEQGHFMAADFVELIGKPTKLDRSEGDVHADGNPHIQTDPRHFLQISQALTQRLQIIDPTNADFYSQQNQLFTKKWQLALQRWEELAKNLKGKRIITHHKSWVYLIRWLGLEEVATLEPKVGLPPTSGHLANVLEKAKQSNVQLIVYSNYEDSKAANWLAEKTQIKQIMLPMTVGGTQQANDLESWFDDLLNRLL